MLIPANASNMEPAEAIEFDLQMFAVPTNWPSDEELAGLQSAINAVYKIISGLDPTTQASSIGYLDTALKTCLIPLQQQWMTQGVT